MRELTGLSRTAITSETPTVTETLAHAQGCLECVRRGLDNNDYWGHAIFAVEGIPRQ